VADATDFDARLLIQHAQGSHVVAHLCAEGVGFAGAAAVFEGVAVAGLCAALPFGRAFVRKNHPD
jgi:hypothetical protein